MIGYKLFRKMRDGYAPLFINKRLRLREGVIYTMEDHPTKGYAHRPGWHICSTPFAPHLRQGGDRVHSSPQRPPSSLRRCRHTRPSTGAIGKMRLALHGCKALTPGNPTGICCAKCATNSAHRG